MIAVTLLILAGAYGVVAATVSEKENNMDRMQDEFAAVGGAVTYAQETLERGIGEIILGMGRESVSGDIEERCGSFGRRLSGWIDFQFPMRANGAVVNLVSHDIELGIGSLKVASADPLPTEGTRPSCFRADGSAVISITTSAGSVLRDIYVSADGMSALPLLLEGASLFSIAVTGPRSLITELMTYQLTALAQYRVISGYGALSEFGEKGTASIITEDDVRTAYRIALSIAETTYLRTTSDDEYDLSGYTGVDAGELLAFRDGTMTIDLGAVFAQALMSIADDLVLRWMDYFMFNKIIELLDMVVDTLRSAFNWLCRVFLGSEAESAQGYLSATMSRLGIPESEYRYMLNGTYASISLPSVGYTYNGNLIDIPACTMNIAYPNTDLLGWNGWNGFMDRYYKERNQIMETLMGMVRSIAVEIAGSSGLGAMKIECDPFDDTNLIDTMSGAVTRALKEQRDAAEEMIESVVRSYKVIDTMYVAIYEHLAANADDAFGVNKLKDSIRQEIKGYVGGIIGDTYGMPLDPYVIDAIADQLMGTGDVVSVIKEYKKVADGKMEVLDTVLNDVEKSTNSMFKDIVVLVVRYGMDVFGLYPLVERRMDSLVREMAEFISLTSMSDVYELPGTDSFLLGGSDGVTMKEYVTLDCDVTLGIKISPPTKGTENVHYVGLSDDLAAAYSSMFRIDVVADLDYEARSSSSLMRLLGTYDAAVSGTSHSKFDLAIAVMSAGPLAGVAYKASDTVVNDIVKALMKIVEPFLKPLFELKKLADKVLNVIMGLITRAADFVSDLLMKLYNAIMGPIEMFTTLLNNLLGVIFEDVIAIINITLKSQAFGIEWHGMRFEIIVDAIGEMTKGASTTKFKLTMPVFGVTLTAMLELKKDKNGKFAFTGRVGAHADTWEIDIIIDPLMKVRKSIVEINGTFRGVDIHAAMPQIVQYDEFELRLSDIPGLGTILSNIPLPIPGLKGSLDAGLEIKYNLPYVYGVVINEFELNPPGNDAGNEWVELYNSTFSTVDLEGYMLAAFSKGDKYYTIHDMTIGPGEHVVITFPTQFLNNTKESVTLFDPDGNVVDYTPQKNDSADDDRTWQRETDGSAKWVFKKGTKGEDNGGKIMGGSPLRAAVVQCMLDAGKQAFGEMGSKIVGPDGVALFLKRVIELTIQNAINMIANCVVSASIFIELSIGDGTGSVHGGIKFSLVLGREIIKDGLNWAVGQVVSMMKNIDNPTGMTPKQILSDDIYFQTMIFARVTTPKILGPIGNIAGITAGVVIECNLTALCTLFGKSEGQWRVNAGLVFEGFPPYLAPPMMKVDLDKKVDLWLFRLTLEKSMK
jgi:hypothetical protein